MPNTIEVILTNQSFQEAGGRAEFKDLEIVELLGATAQFRKCEGDAREEAYSKLKIIARNVGCTHVFKVEYISGLSQDTHPSRGFYECEVRGTGYRPRTK